MATQKPTTDHKTIINWARENRAVPCEILPPVVDSLPAILRLMLEDQVEDHKNIRQISWEEFFLKFDSLGLTFAFDRAAPGRSEILQIEERSPYRPPAYNIDKLSN